MPRDVANTFSDDMSSLKGRCYYLIANTHSSLQLTSSLNVMIIAIGVISIDISAICQSFFGKG